MRVAKVRANTNNKNNNKTTTTNFVWTQCRSTVPCTPTICSRHSRYEVLQNIPHNSPNSNKNENMDAQGMPKRKSKQTIHKYTHNTIQEVHAQKPTHAATWSHAHTTHTRTHTKMIHYMHKYITCADMQGWIYGTHAPLKPYLPRHLVSNLTSLNPKHWQRQFSFLFKDCFKLSPFFTSTFLFIKK